MADSQQMRFVPIAGTVTDGGVVTYSGVSCQKYNVNLTPSNGQAQNVSLSVPSGCYVSASSANVPVSGTTVQVYVPTSNTGGVDLTVSESGYSPNPITVQQAN